MSTLRTNYSVFLERPTHLIVGGGLWHLARKMKAEDIESRFKNVRKTLELLFDKETLIFQLQTKSLFYDHGLYGDEEIEFSNKMVSDIFGQTPSIKIFDSHLKLFDAYADVCRRNFLPRRKNVATTSSSVSATTTFWRCHDPNHSPFLLTRHFAQLILNQLLCFPK